MLFIAFSTLGGSRRRLRRRLKNGWKREAAVSARMGLSGAGRRSTQEPAEGMGGKLPGASLDLEVKFKHALHPGGCGGFNRCAHSAGPGCRTVCWGVGGLFEWGLGGA